VYAHVAIFGNVLWRAHTYIYVHAYFMYAEQQWETENRKTHQQRESERDEEHFVRVLWIEGWARQGDACMYAILSLFVRHAFI